MLSALRCSTLVALLGLLAWCPVTSAAEPAVEELDPVSAAILRLDPDKDGYLTWADVKAAAQRGFGRLDRNRDGVLGSTEVRGTGITLTDLRRADPDQDGSLDQAEFLALAEARFKLADADGDGKVGTAELRNKVGHLLSLLILR
ncbi:MAG: hypothetical protein RLZZ584_790 [Pseudomonadota bacterium]|jgi:Ca2+-binding EF-hand superfamily protein